MKNDDLNTIWVEIESHSNHQRSFLHRMIYVHLLWRAYIGVSGLPSRRFLSIEIPEEKESEFDTFTAPQGFTLTVGKPGVEHEGYAACILQAASSDQNDVFTVLAQDVLEELSKQNDADKYIETLKKRILKWRDFFKNPAKNKLSERTVIGLIGELSFIKEMNEDGIDIASDLWNGPINAAQDFQGNRVAMEVKTAVSNSLDRVHISSEEQLDDSERDALFLVVYRAERNDATGITLPVLIKDTARMLSERQRLSFYAKLICMGYSADDASLYNKGYSVKEQKVFAVKEGFPRVLRPDLPQGIMDINYQLSLQSCEGFESSREEIVSAIKEYEYGEG